MRHSPSHLTYGPDRLSRERHYRSRGAAAKGPAQPKGYLAHCHIRVEIGGHRGQFIGCMGLLPSSAHSDPRHHRRPNSGRWEPWSLAPWNEKLDGSQGYLQPPYGRGDVRPSRCYHPMRWCGSHDNARGAPLPRTADQTLGTKGATLWRGRGRRRRGGRWVGDETPSLVPQVNWPYICFWGIEGHAMF